MAEFVNWDDRALEDLLQGVDGPVGRWLTEKVTSMTAYAVAGAPVRKPKNFSWGKRSTSYPRVPEFGYLKSSIRPVIGYTARGQLFGGTNAAYGPTLFLQDGGGPHHGAERIPFLTAALYAVTLD